jgi:hypothetical protein
MLNNKAHGKLYEDDGQEYEDTLILNCIWSYEFISNG